MRSWIVVFALVVCAVVCVADSEATAKPRESGPRLDSTFGRGGAVTLRAPSQRHASRTFAADDWEVRDAVADESGRVYVLTAGFGAARSVLTAYDAQGKLDREFGSDGAVALGVLGRFHSAELDSEGRILVLGYPDLPDDDSSGTTLFRDRGVVVVRVFADGRLDPSFGTGGVWRRTTELTAVGLSTDGLGRILVLTVSLAEFAETLVLRLGSDGMLDATYYQDGIAPLPSDAIEGERRILDAWTVDASLRFVGLFSVYEDLDDVAPHYVLLRFDASGHLDFSLGEFGTLALDIGASEHRVSHLDVDSMGRYVILAGGDSPFIARFLDDGTPDPTWSGSADGVRQLLLDGDSSKTSLSSLTIDGDVYYATGVRNRRRGRGPGRAVVVRVDGDTEQVWTSRSRRFRSAFDLLDVRDDTVLALGRDRGKGRTKRAASSLVRLRFD